MFDVVSCLYVMGGALISQLLGLSGLRGGRDTDFTR